jgi:hypothetical protein
VTPTDLQRELALLVENASNDTQTVTSTRIPSNEEMRRLFWAMQSGQKVEF